ncbi:hypothetical protein Trydic_g20535 [Trypoxylus dichotomus]
MSVEEFLKKVDTLIVADEELTKMCCEIQESTEQHTKFFETNDIKQFNDRNEELNKLLEEVNIRAQNLEKKLAELEVESKQLESKKVNPQFLEKLDTLKTTLKCTKTIFPVEFDYSEKNMTGFMYNKNTNEYRGFKLSPKDTAANTKYAWKHLEKLYS